MLFMMLAFSVVRPHNTVVYAPKTKYADEKHAPPQLSKGLFSWTMPLFSVHEAELVEKIGLDGTIFLRFTKMCRNIFICTIFVAIGLILPTNVVNGGHSDEAKTFHVTGFWATSTPQYLSGSFLWVHVVGAWLINGIVVFFLWWNYKAVTRLRRKYFESPEYLRGLHSRTLMFADIPPASRTDEGLLRLADEVEHTSGLPRAAIARNVKELPELIEQHEKAVRALEGILAKYLKNPDNLPANRPTLRPSKNYRKNNGGDEVDAIEYLADRIAELEMEIKHVRQSIDKRNPMPYGFASYETIEDAHTVAYAAQRKHPQGTTIELAPKPNDLIWKNLPLTKKEKSWKRFINNFWITILTFVWIAPNALIAIFLSNLSNLANFWPAFRKDFDGNHLAWSIVQGIASPLLTSLVYLILPIIFRRLSIHAGDRTKTSRERHVTTKMYAFFVFNNLIVFSVFSALWAYVTQIISSSHLDHESVWDAIKNGYFFSTLLAGLVEISPFWLTFLVQRNLGSAANLAQLYNLTIVWFYRKFMSPTPRQAIEWSAPPPCDYAVFYNYILFYATVALCFTTIQPMVIPVTAFFFVVEYWLKKYLLLYVLVTKTESGGQFWRILFNRLIFATILADLFMAVVVKSAGSWVMIGVMGPLPFIMLAFKFYCTRIFDASYKFYTTTHQDPEHLAGQKSRKGNDRVGTRFGHPALYAKLMTPMVHAKAQHVLASIYRGRMTDTADPATEYSDIAMSSMSAQFPGKTARFAEDPSTKKNDLFEIVPESKLDFGYFKNRADFRDENGGDGELYGRPTDLISERSGTPHSFMRGSVGGGSPSSSRASSPGAGAYRAFSPEQLGQMTHPAYRTTPPGGHSRNVSAQSHSRNISSPPPLAGIIRPGLLYSASNESERSLLAGAQPAPYEEGDGREMYGLDRWRTGSSGYVGVPAQEEGMGYETYRGRR